MSAGADDAATRTRWPRYRWRQTKRAISVLLCVWAILVVNDQFLRWAARQNPSSRVNWLYQDPTPYYEMAILGSSMLKQGIDPTQLSECTASSIVQLAWGGRGIAEQSLYWELFLKRHECGILLLELHPRGLEYDALPHPLDEFRYIAHLDDPVVRRHLKRHCGVVPVVAWRWIPMLAMARYSTQIGWHDLLALRHHQPFDPNRLIENRSHANPKPLLVQRWSADKLPGWRPEHPQSVQQFREIVQLARQRNIRIVAVMPPVYQGFLADQLDWLDRYRQLLGPDVPVFMPAGDYLHDPARFDDAWHVNAKGRAAFTAELCMWLARQESAWASNVLPSSVR